MPAAATSGRGRVIVLFAAVLALQGADLATVGAFGGQLEGDLGIDHLQLGVLAATVSIVSALATLPFGVLADRVNRVRLLAWAVGLWALAMVAAGLSASFAELLATRCFLGIVIAAAAPLLASLMGDFFPGGERGKVYGYVLTGELIGSGFGFLVSGNVAGLLSWRWSFWLLALPSLVLAAGLPRLLAEPKRRARREGRREEIPWATAFRRVLSVRTNVVLIVVSSTGYLFLGGVQTFGVIFMRREYGLSQSPATSMLGLLGLGALAGVLAGGRVADRLLRDGRVDARILVPSIAFLAAAAIAAIPFAAAWPLVYAMPLFVLATGVLTAGNPPLDAARLDVMPPELWGRAEAVRTVLRSLAVTAAPPLFGFLASAIGNGSGEALRLSFLVMLAPLGAAGAILLRARRTYPADAEAAGPREGGR
ncbi:MAG TPA: MFS transporter [Solirubrobacterales bacterium]|nr:MFS transporter [Solirubrobacterales bacterium]